MTSDDMPALAYPLLARDAAGAGAFVRVHLGPPKRRSRLTLDERDQLAYWAACWAGHWGRRALGQDKESAD